MAILKDYIDPADLNENSFKKNKRPRDPDSSEEKLSAPPSKLRFLGNAQPVAPEPPSYKEVFNRAIEEFFQATKGHLNKKLVSDIILAVADIYRDDSEMEAILLNGPKENYLRTLLMQVIQTAYESSAALKNPDAIAKLKLYREMYPEQLEGGNRFRATPEARQNQTITKEIDESNQERQRK